MGTFIVHVTDAGKMDRAVEVTAQPEQLGEVIGNALSEMFREEPTPWTCPLFVDVHPAENYRALSWMYEEPASPRLQPAGALDS